MEQLSLKEAVVHISKVRELIKEDKYEISSPALSFHLVKIYKIWKELEFAVTKFKQVLLQKSLDQTVFVWEEDMKVRLGNKAATSSIDVEAMYKVAVKNKLVPEFFAACNIVESRITNPILLAAVVTNKIVTPGAENSEIKVEKITKADRLVLNEH